MLRTSMLNIKVKIDLGLNGHGHVDLILIRDTLSGPDAYMYQYKQSQA